MSVIPSIIFYLLFLMTDQHNYETSWPSLGSLHKPYKTNLYGNNFIIVSAINAWNNSQKLLKISLRHLPPNKIKTFCQMLFFQSIEMNCQLSDILNQCLMISKFCRHYICFSLFSMLLLFYNIHFPIWCSFDILN